MTSLTNTSVLSNNSKVKTYAHFALAFSAIGSVACAGMRYYDYKQKKLLNNSDVDNAAIYDKYTTRYVWLKEIAKVSLALSMFSAGLGSFYILNRNKK